MLGIRAVAVAFGVCLLVAGGGLTVAAEEDTGTCATTEVLVAMKGLLIMLSGEIRDLRRQVRLSCVRGAGSVSAPDGDNATRLEDDILQQAIDESMNTTITDDIYDSDDFDYDYSEDDLEDGDSPLDATIGGISDWWENFSPFAPKPSTTSTTTSPTPVLEQSEDDVVDDDETDDDQDDTEDDDQDDTEDDEDDYRPTERRTTTTEAITAAYTTPPPRTSCPTPFRLEAGSCYIIMHDERDWRSWGDAHALCQEYSGGLAAPWRLPELQEHLGRYFSDAFWVGAHYVPQSRSWQWLSGRPVERNEWKVGQPGRNPSKKCAFLDKWSGYRAKNHFCGVKHPFICEHYP